MKSKRKILEHYIYTFLYIRAVDLQLTFANGPLRQCRPYKYIVEIRLYHDFWYLYGTTRRKEGSRCTEYGTSSLVHSYVLLYSFPYFLNTWSTNNLASSVPNFVPTSTLFTEKERSEFILLANLRISSVEYILHISRDTNQSHSNLLTPPSHNRCNLEAVELLLALLARHCTNNKLMMGNFHLR